MAELWALRHPAASSILAYAEARAALAAAHRGDRLSSDGCRRGCEEFESLQGELWLIGIDGQLVRHAGQLAEAFALRGYDAVHLASALACGDAVTFVSWDRELRGAAAQSGCAIVPAD